MPSQSVREAKNPKHLARLTPRSTFNMHCATVRGALLFAWDESHTQERISKKPQSPECLSYNTEVRIKRLKCFVFSWNQSRKSSASLSLLCVKNCQSLILLDCCDSILLPFCLCSPLHIYTQISGFLVNRPVCTGADLRVVKQGYKCCSVTLVSVARSTHHDKQMQPAPSSYQSNLMALPTLQPSQHPFSVCYTSETSTSK